MGFDLTGLGSLFDFGTKVLERVIPDPEERAKAQLELMKAQKQGDAQLEPARQQNEVNKVEAASPNLFVSGWRPAIGSRDLEAANQAWFTYDNHTLGADDHFHRTSSTGRCGSSLSMRLPRRESRAFARTFARLPSTRSISRCRAARALSASRFSRSASGPCPVAVIRLFRR